MSKKFAEKNEIPHEKYDKPKTKYNDKPVLVVKVENITAEDVKETASAETEETLKLEEVPSGTKLKSVLVCPRKDVHRPLFSLPCFSNSNCGFLGSEVLCCDGRCLKGAHELREDAHQARKLVNLTNYALI